MKKEIILAEIATSEYIAQFRDVDKFIEFCKACRNYKRVWSCPPFDSAACCGVANIDAFALTTVVGVKINIDEEMRSRPTNSEERDALIRDIIVGVRREFDDALLALEREVQSSRLYYAGSCCLCAPGTCSRIEGEVCRFPLKMRSTLEAIGFDMGRTTSELLGIEMKWCEELTLPPYFTLVYGFLANCHAADQIKGILADIPNVEVIENK